MNLVSEGHVDLALLKYKVSYKLGETRVANGSTTTLEFRSTTGSGFGSVIDDVEVEGCLLIICLG